MASFYNDVRSNNYKNTFYLMNIYLDQYLASQLLNNDQTRIIYSSTEYALTKRSGKNEWNNANLPFINYKMESKEIGGSRNWFNFESYGQGIYIDELGFKVKLVPITINYDCTFWCSNDYDYQYAIDKMLINSSAETKIEYYYDYNGSQVPNLGIISHNLDTSIRFTENDWLTNNNIWAFGINPSIQTNLLFSNDSGFCIPKTVLFNYVVNKNLLSIETEEIVEYETLYTATINHLTETVTWN